MATIGSEVLSYKGDARAGAGANADIPVLAPIDNNVINQTGRDLMMLNHENNVRIYQQKIVDRNKELQALDSGQVETGTILDKDRPVIDKLQKEADKQFFDMVAAGGLNNKQAYRKYESKVKELKDATTWAQHRYLGRNKVEGEKANQTLKADQEAYDKYLEEEDKKPFYSGQYLGRQKSLSYDAEDITETGWQDVLGAPTATTNREVVKTAPDGKQTLTETKTTVPIKGGKGTKGTTGGVAPVADVSTTTIKRNGKTYQVTQSQIDFNKIRQNQINAYADQSGKHFENQKLHRDIFETAPDEVFEPFMNHIVKRATDYNNDKGLTEGQPGYIDTNKLAQDLGIDPQTGKRTGQKIMMSTPDFAAYTALAAYNGSYAPKSESFNKEESEFDLKKGLNDANIFYKNALGNAALKKASAYAKHLDAKVKALKGTAEQEQFIGDIYRRNIVEQENLVTGMGGNTVRLSQIQANKSLPVFTFDGSNPKQLKPIGSTDIVDNAGHIIGYKGGYYDQEYRINGKKVTPQRLADDYQDFKKNNDPATLKKLGVNSFDDFIKEAVKNDIYDVKLIGENGSTDLKLTIAAQRAISNKVTKKDQDGVFDEPTDAAPVEQ